MSLNLVVHDLIRIANAGGGMTLSAKSFVVDDLIRIASASSGKRARLKIVDANFIRTDDLIRIANAGGGCVDFE